jgi:hypothetical protein
VQKQQQGGGEGEGEMFDNQTSGCYVIIVVNSISLTIEEKTV